MGQKLQQGRAAAEGPETQEFLVFLRDKEVQSNRRLQEVRMHLAPSSLSEIADNLRRISLGTCGSAERPVLKYSKYTKCCLDSERKDIPTFPSPLNELQAWTECQICCILLFIIPE